MEDVLVSRRRWPAREGLAASRGLARVAKRGFDILFAGAGLVASSPFWAVIAVAVKAGDGGPVFFRQERVGEGGRVFDVLKFRSMIPNAESGLGAVQATGNDSRVTRVGRLMRATALDELPQLWNILRGDMSVVGPRALRPGEIEVNGPGAFVPSEAIPGFAERSSVRPGLTGLAQVYAARDIPRRQKFRYDCVYIRRWSFALDMQLVALSIWTTVRGAWGKQGRRP
jgi:lipopolysaccharide/colanic/teichoic acid biosynthesis glycosyltransferase